MTSPRWTGNSVVSQLGGESTATSHRPPADHLRAEPARPGAGLSGDRRFAPSRQIALTPMIVSDVNHGGVHLVARPGLAFPVVHTEDGELMVDLPVLGIMVVANDRDELARSLEAAIAAVWTEYMSANVDLRDPQASRRRFRLIECFKPY